MKKRKLDILEKEILKLTEELQKGFDNRLPKLTELKSTLNKEDPLSPGGLKNILNTLIDTAKILVQVQYDHFSTSKEQIRTSHALRKISLSIRFLAIALLIVAFKAEISLLLSNYAKYIINGWPTLPHEVQYTIIATISLGIIGFLLKNLWSQIFSEK